MYDLKHKGDHQVAQLLAITYVYGGCQCTRCPTPLACPTIYAVPQPRPAPVLLCTAQAQCGPIGVAACFDAKLGEHYSHTRNDESWHEASLDSMTGRAA